jgi:subtilisin-like proprotein convertase family protein
VQPPFSNESLQEGSYSDFPFSISAEDVLSSSDYYQEFYGSNYDLDKTDNADNLCIEDVSLTLTLKHPCTRQLTVSLFGPGENTWAANFMPFASTKVNLFYQHEGNGTGCSQDLQQTTFNDDAPFSIGECCHEPYEGTFRPIDRLRTFKGVDPTGEWKLRVYDRLVDGVNGTLTSFSLDFVVSECKKTYRWQEIVPSNTSSAAMPRPRYGHSTIVADDAIFVIGGVTETGRTSDLWRFDVSTRVWTELFTEGLDAPLPYIGRMLIISPFGLIAGFGYHRGKGGIGSPKFSYRFSLQNIVTEEWSDLLTSDTYSPAVPYYHRAIGTKKGNKYPELHEIQPAGRMMGGGILVLDEQDLALYGSEADFPDAFDSSAGAYEDTRFSPLIYSFGGDNGMRLLDDFRALRFNRMAYPSLKWEAAAYLQEQCKWRIQSGSAAEDDWNHSCNVTSMDEQTRTCKVRDLVLRAWCTRNFQSLSNL